MTRTRRWRRWLGWPAAMLLVVAASGTTLTIGLSGTDNPAPASSDEPVTRTPDTPAPPLVGRTLDGEAFDLARWRGHVVLVNVLASWCGPCRDELPLLAAAERRWSGQGLRLVGVDVRDGTEPARTMLRETGAQDLTVVADPDGALAVGWGTRGVPETFVVDRDGRIRYWAQGPVTATWLEQRLAPLLAP